MLHRKPERIADRVAKKAYGIDSSALHRQHERYAGDLLARNTGESLSHDVDYGKMLSTVAIRSLSMSSDIYMGVSRADRGLLLCQKVFAIATTERAQPIDEAFELSASRLQETVLRGTTSQVGKLLRRAKVAGTVYPPSVRLAEDPSAHQYITEAYRKIHQEEFDADPNLHPLHVADLMGEAVELAVTPTLNHEVRVFDVAIREVYDQLLPKAS